MKYLLMGFGHHPNYQLVDQSSYHVVYKSRFFLPVAVCFWYLSKKRRRVKIVTAGSAVK